MEARCLRSVSLQCHMSQRFAYSTAEQPRRIVLLSSNGGDVLARRLCMVHLGLRVDRRNCSKVLFRYCSIAHTTRYSLFRVF